MLRRGARYIVPAFVLVIVFLLIWQQTQAGATGWDRLKSSWPGGYKPVAGDSSVPETVPETASHPATASSAPHDSQPAAGTVPEPISGSSAEHAAGFPSEAEDKRLHNYLARFVGKLPPLSPTMAPLHNIDPKTAEEFFDMHNDKIPITKEQMSKYLKVSSDDVAALKELHKKVVDLLPQTIPEGLWKRGRGIVLTGGGIYFPILLSTIKWLVDTQKGIPIEVFMAEEEYEPAFCEDLFPSLGARCVVVERVFGMDVLKHFEYMGYPLKLLAILASSFEDTYFMDVDSLPVVSVADVFQSSAYSETGYILFPDYWQRATVPQFYEVADIDLKVPHWYRTSTGEKPLVFNQMEGAIPEFQSSESGQIYVNKRDHYRSLLLTLYYNLNGFNYYFPLLTIGRGVPGFGDKDTFVAAAHVMGERYYQVRHNVGTLGYKENDEFHGTAILQKDPRPDYENYLKADFSERLNDLRFPLAAVHTTMLKLNPVSLYSDVHREGKLGDWIRAERRRYFGPLSRVKETVAPTDVGDLERKMFEGVRYSVCEWMVKEKRVPKSMAALGEAELEKVCARATEQVEFLDANPNVE